MANRRPLAHADPRNSSRRRRDADLHLAPRRADPRDARRTGRRPGCGDGCAVVGGGVCWRSTQVEERVGTDETGERVGRSGVFQSEYGWIAVFRESVMRET